MEIHLATFLFGLAGLFGKWLALSPFLIVFGRVVFAAAVLGLILLATRQSLQLIWKRRAVVLLILGGVLTAHWVTFFRSIQVSSVAVGLLAYSCFPVFTVLLECLFLKERFDRFNLAMAVLCLAGVFVIVPRFELANRVYQGVLWGLAAGLTFAVLTLCNRRLAQKYSSLAIAFFEDSFAAIFLIPFFFLSSAHISGRDWLLLAFLGVVCTALAHTLFIRGMRWVRAQTASIISSLEPVYGIVFAFVLLGEAPVLRTLAGGMIILAAVLAVSLREAS